ncbi:hypothetical protein C8J57DRAFT_1637134 [Mycena rebaudengoi]|nr:hypothetical protein C8J57DRAFT_1637134 [Mycena rebaudengoi]
MLTLSGYIHFLRKRRQEIATLTVDILTCGDPDTGYRDAGSLIRRPDGFWLFKALRALNKKAGFETTLRDFLILVGVESGPAFPDQRDSFSLEGFKTGTSSSMSVGTSKPFHGRDGRVLRAVLRTKQFSTERDGYPCHGCRGTVNTAPVHFPMRSFFTNAPCTHALVFAPTHEYWPPADKWDTFSHTGKFCGLTFDLFVNRGASVYYAGIYTMLSLTGEAPGFDIPADVSPAAIHHAARLGNRKMPNCFPDGKIKVKCYGLQFLGFDMGLYEQLRLRYLASTNEGMKRKAGTADLSAGGGSAKMQKTQ